MVLNSNDEIWQKTRHGAWAGRGFHYQHLVVTLLVVRQWAGIDPTGSVVPEGQEDCVVEFEGHDVWVQIKSRKNGSFSLAEVQSITKGIHQKVITHSSQEKISIILALEQQCESISENNWGQLYEKKCGGTVVCTEPQQDIMNILSSALDTSDIIVEKLFSDLYKLVAETAVANASVSFQDRKHIFPSDIERRIYEFLEAVDSSLIDEALKLCLIEPLDLTTPVIEQSFYQGIKVQPGHIVAGLAFSRTQETYEIVDSLNRTRQILISGPSGAGKSALLWLTAQYLQKKYRLFRVTAQAGPQSSDSIIRFIRSRRPTMKSPIFIAIDEVDSSNSNLWNILGQELLTYPNVYLIGSIRLEDIALISNSADIELYEIRFDDKLAKSIWKELDARKQTDWHHWREPFEQSQGLMLEYVHILTQGKRLEDLIGGQVRQREHEGRDDELAILRAASSILMRGGEVQMSFLLGILNIPKSRASKALRRLLDEHLILESRPGVLGGLHALRSKALCFSSHDEVIYIQSETFWDAFGAIASESISNIIRGLFNENQHESPIETICIHLATILSNEKNLDRWVAILTGLGLATLEKQASIFISILRDQNLTSAQFSLASMFCDPHIKIPEFDGFEQFDVVRKALFKFKAVPVVDLRLECIRLMPEGYQVPHCGDFEAANRLLSCLMPLLGGEPVNLPLNIDKVPEDSCDIKKLSLFLSTAYLIGNSYAKDVVDTLGGEEYLLNVVYEKIPWLSKPLIEENGEHGRTVSANRLFISEDEMNDLNEIVCEICEILISICPSSNAVACAAIDPAGNPVRTGEHVHLSKNIPRENLPSKARVAWNVAFRQIIYSQANTDSLTYYAQQLVTLIERTEKVFRKFIEQWVSGQKTNQNNMISDEVNSIIAQVNELSYVNIQPLSGVMVDPKVNAVEEDTIRGLLTDILENLMRRINFSPGDSGIKGTACFAASLAGKAEKLSSSKVWRVVDNEPKVSLNSISKRLMETSNVLNELSEDNSPNVIKLMLKAAKKGLIGKRLNSASRWCRHRADKRFLGCIAGVEKQLKNLGLDVKCIYRFENEFDTVYWPAKEISILVYISDFEDQADYIEDVQRICDAKISGRWEYNIVPVVNQFVISSLVFLSINGKLFPNYDFSEKWMLDIQIPFLSSPISEAFDDSVNACFILSAITKFRDLDELHVDEISLFEKEIERYRKGHAIILSALEASEIEVYAWAVDFIENLWGKVASEFEYAKEAKEAKEAKDVISPICLEQYRTLAEEESELMNEFAAGRMLIRQEEARSIVV